MTDQTIDNERADQNNQPVMNERADPNNQPEKVERPPFTPIVLASLSQMPRCIYQEYAGSLEGACEYHLAKFHKLPSAIYQYQYRYFFPLDEKE